QLPRVGGELGHHARVGQRDARPYPGPARVGHVHQPDGGFGVAAHSEGAAVGAQGAGHHHTGGHRQARDGPGGGSEGGGEDLDPAVGESGIDGAAVGGHGQRAGEAGVRAGDDAAGLEGDRAGGVHDRVVQFGGGDAQDTGGAVGGGGGLE